jgi:hypothetical protein
MIVGYQGMREVWRTNGGAVDLRTAAMITAIDKIAAAYMELGIFP